MDTITEAAVYNDTDEVVASVTNLTHYWEEDMSRFLYAVPSTIFMIIGTIGNVLSFIVFSRKAMKKSVTSVYFRALAVSDTVVLFSGGMVFFVMGAFNIDIRVVSEAACKFWIPLLRVSCYHSCWILVFIAVDRFIGVYMPHKYRQFCTKRRAIAAMCAWLFIVLVVVGAFWVTVLTVDDNACGVAKPYQSFHTEVYRWFDLTALNLIPSALLVGLNATIIVKIIRSTSPDARSTKSTKVASPTVILISVSVVYMLCTIPSSTVFIVIAAFHGARKHAQTVLYIRSCETLYLANHAVNFFLYCVHGTSFRRELLALFGRRSEIVTNEKNASTSSKAHSTQLTAYRKYTDTENSKH